MSLANMLSQLEIDSSGVQKYVTDGLIDADDGELFIERRRFERLVRDRGRVGVAEFSKTSGMGFRFVADEAVGYAYSNDTSKTSLKRAIATARAAGANYSGSLDINPSEKSLELYNNSDPTSFDDFSKKLSLMEDIEHYIKSKDSRVVQVTIALVGSVQEIAIIRAGGARAYDYRPLTRAMISVIIDNNGRQESGSSGIGGRYGWDRILNLETLKERADEALRTALVNLEAVASPRGEQSVILGAGWPGILLHEAVGHSLEGDFNYKKNSVFSGMLGETIAAPGVTLVDDGTIPERRGSISIDDEGEPSQRTVLIENGVLTNYMHDRLSARKMGTRSTGNGRRESFAHQPFPRMTNTFMLSGDSSADDLLTGVNDGIFAKSFGGGQVDIVSGKFVFECTEAYRIRGGKIAEPVRGAMIVGDGRTSLKKISQIANDSSLDDGIGTCGKNGQWVPVGVGQPSLRIDEITVGGTD